MSQDGSSASRRTILAIIVGSSNMNPTPLSHYRAEWFNGAGNARRDILADRFDLRDTAGRVRIDLSASHLWDITAMGALEEVVTKMRHHGITVEVIGLNQASAILVDRLAPTIGGAIA